MRRAGSVLFSVVLLGTSACPSSSRPPERGRSEASPVGDPEPPPEPRSSEPAPAAKVFRAQVAGPRGRGFYTSDADQLRRQIDGFLDAAEASPELEGRDLLGLVSPHAGYEYSGPTAARSYRQLRGRHYSTVVVLALSHHQAASRVALLDADAYETPLGQLPIDRDLVHRLAAAEPDLLEADDRVFRGEHSLEVQLPMLQRALEGRFSIVPIILATRDEDHCERLARLLHRELGRRRDVLFVASTDLSHFFPYDDASRMDRDTLGLVTSLDIAGFRRRGPRQREMPCGYFPLLTLMELFSQYDAAARRATLLGYQNSGDTAGDREGVVGYGAVAFSLAPGTRTEDAPPPEPVSREDRQTLMDIARRAVRAAVTGSGEAPPRPASPFLTADGAAFVTLTCHTDGAGHCVGPGDDLRGCIGHVVARIPLYRCIDEVARSAAVSDRRFPRVTERELDDLSFEISVLTPPEPVTDPGSVVVGRDGLIMTRGEATGLLLPQVPVEWGWDRVQFLERTCHKAGMEPSCWQDPRTRIERFGAIVWGEDLELEDRR